LDLTKDTLPYRFAGYQDWRLPSRAELETLIEPNCQEPATNIQAFPTMAAVDLWSSDVSQHNDQMAWGIDFTKGRSHEYFRIASKYVRLVRDAR
ncbi:MAG: DUF1566 domain-containing protein, partial [Thiothrix sp.]